MITPLTLAQVENYCRESLNAILHNGDVEFSQVNTDTRTLAAGELFIALRGENFDAHDFLAQAVEKNICGCVVEKFQENIPLPQLVVADTLRALGQIAAMNRAAFKKPVLAITGSSGKTTVKTMLADILAECGNVLATKGNFNNHIGVPLTLLRIDATHDFAVIEMGASAIGEIAYLCSLAKPDISMINNVMPAHIEGFGSIEGVAQAKGEIYKQLPYSGMAVINIDDVFAAQWINDLGNNYLTVSLNNEIANCHAKNNRTYIDAVEFTLVINTKEIQVRLNALGEHSIRNALMAAAMAYATGASLENIQQGLKKFAPVGGRMSRHVGVNNSQIIDDSYNANPGSVRAAIDVLSAQSGQRILVLGDLGELGDKAAQLHGDLGTYAQIKKLDQLFTLGTLSRYTSESFGANAIHFNSREELISHIKNHATSHTTLLIKGSRSAHMDLIVKALCDLGEHH